MKNCALTHSGLVLHTLSKRGRRIGFVKKITARALLAKLLGVSKTLVEILTRKFSPGVNAGHDGDGKTNVVAFKQATLKVNVCLWKLLFSFLCLNQPNLVHPVGGATLTKT